jgi:glycosyltransferase involved in cell wall biosynthesis
VVQLSNVEFHGYVPQERMPELMSTAHLHLVSLIDHPLFEVTIPSKLQLLLAAGAPLLVTAPGEAAAVTQRSGAGIVAAASNPEDIARALRQALDQPDEWFAAAGRAGRDYYFAHMSAAINAERLRTVVRDVLSGRP